jgi:hypothetical protein
MRDSSDSTGIIVPSSDLEKPHGNETSAFTHDFEWMDSGSLHRPDPGLSTDTFVLLLQSCSSGLITTPALRRILREPLGT